jgi:RNA polymerase sigma-70 factor (ECF subfamily)
MHQPPSQEFNEQEIKTDLRQGRPEALGLLYDKYAPVLLGLATRITCDQEAAETVLQKTFIAFWRRRAEYESTSLSLLSWLIILTRDMAMETMKSAATGNLRKAAPNLKPNLKGQNQNDRQAEIKIKEKYCNLAPNEKAALDLVYLQGYSCTEAAAELGIAEETLKDWLKTASQHLREGIGK